MRDELYSIEEINFWKGYSFIDENNVMHYCDQETVNLASDF